MKWTKRLTKYFNGEKAISKKTDVKEVLVHEVLRINEDDLTESGFDAANNEIYYYHDKPFTGFAISPYAEIEYLKGYMHSYERHFHDDKNTQLDTEYYFIGNGKYTLKAWDNSGVLIYHALCENHSGKKLEIYVDTKASNVIK